MRQRSLWFAMLAVLVACLPHAAAAQEQGAAQPVGDAIGKLWAALGGADEDGLRAVLHSPCVITRVGGDEGAQGRVTVESVDEICRQVKGQPRINITLSVVQVTMLGENAAAASYSVTPAGGPTTPIVSMLSRIDTWRVTSTAVPAQAGATERAPFSVNPTRLDPYKNFKFRVKWDGKYIPGVSKVSPLARVTEVTESQEGGAPSISHRSPGRTKYAPLVLERGVTHDQEFENWANLVWRFGAGLGSEASLKTFRKDIVVEIYNEAGQLAKAYKVYRCWPSHYQALPTLDANGNEVALETLTLENEGWERDLSVVEPQERGKSAPPAR